MGRFLFLPVIFLYPMTKKTNLIQNVDYYIQADGNLVFTEKYLRERGHCCQSGCLHCPYSYKDRVDPNIPAEFRDAWEGLDFEDDSDQENED